MKLLRKLLWSAGARSERVDRWRHLKQQAAGMMRADVYRELYEIAFHGPDLDIVEVGGGGGAGGIALALGLKESGKKSRVIVVEKMEGGSRARIGDYATNFSIFEKNVADFGVKDQIALYPHRLTAKNAEEVVSKISTKTIGALVIDADGKLDRDFSIFWPLLPPGGKIVIDDYRDDPGKFTQGGGTKLVQVFRLANYIISVGLFAVEKQLGPTLIGFKPPDADIRRLDLAKCAEIIAGVKQYHAEVIAARNAQG